MKVQFISICLELLMLSLLTKTSVAFVPAVILVNLPDYLSSGDYMTEGQGDNRPTENTTDGKTKKQKTGKTIHIQTRLHCGVHRAYEMFTVNEYLEKWLAPIADVEPWVGGKYEHFFDPSNRACENTAGCVITALVENILIAFEWKGPTEFEHFMNRSDPLTNVTVFFIPAGDGVDMTTDVHLLHAGWGSSVEWDDARDWFETAWRLALNRLRIQLDQR